LPRLLTSLGYEHVSECIGRSWKKREATVNHCS
ncbi:dihydroorotate dehydrogenase catalytic subunit, partial [Priestia megaterium]